MASLLAWGGYVPRLRLNRAKAVEANAWFAPALAALSRGERSMCNWDEDTLTLAVEAGRDCLGERRDSIAALHLASTTAPFADRQNAALVAGALGLDERIGTLDIGASQRAGTSGLVNAFASAKAGKGPVLLIAAEDRLARAGGAAELRNGAGAAALLVGEGPGAAELIGSEQSAVDFVDHFRSQGDAFDYAWEERWVRDAGYFDIVPRTLQALLKRCDVSASSVDHFVMPCTLRGVLPKVAARVGLPESSVRDPLDAVMGEAGDRACAGAPRPCAGVRGAGRARPRRRLRPGLRRAPAAHHGTGRGGKARPRRLGPSRAAPRGDQLRQVPRLQPAGGAGLPACGPRRSAPPCSRRSTATAISSPRWSAAGAGSAAPRSSRAPRSASTPTAAISTPRTPTPSRSVSATVLTWTADRLTYTPDPPAHYGIVQFEGGGRLMADFTDVDTGEVEVGMPMRMVFRIKEQDARRNLKSYFWKAAPA